MTTEDITLHIFRLVEDSLPDLPRDAQVFIPTGKIG
jgi:hypothetical protein